MNRHTTGNAPKFCLSPSLFESKISAMKETGRKTRSAPRLGKSQRVEIFIKREEYTTITNGKSHQHEFANSTQAPIAKPELLFSSFKSYLSAMITPSATDLPCLHRIQLSSFSRILHCCFLNEPHRDTPTHVCNRHSPRIFPPR